MDEDPRQRRHELKRRLLDRRAFIAERVSVPQGTNKNRRKQMSGTNLVYHTCDERARKGLDMSSANEWKKYMDFGATVNVQGQLLDELIQEGHKMIPSQWIETDKKAHLKRPGFEYMHEPEWKSRLVACGHLEDAKDIRADSPTCAT